MYEVQPLPVSALPPYYAARVRGNIEVADLAAARGDGGRARGGRRTLRRGSDADPDPDTAHHPGSDSPTHRRPERAHGHGVRGGDCLAQPDRLRRPSPEC